MDLEHGIALFFIGCTLTFVGFFTAFLIINHNRKKQKELEEAKKNRPIGYWGDDTV